VCVCVCVLVIECDQVQQKAATPGVLNLFCAMQPFEFGETYGPVLRNMYLNA
jgi:hypothetical protein